MAWLSEFGSRAHGNDESRCTSVSLVSARRVGDNREVGPRQDLGALDRGEVVDIEDDDAEVGERLVDRGLDLGVGAGQEARGIGEGGAGSRADGTGDGGSCRSLGEGQGVAVYTGY